MEEKQSISLEEVQFAIKAKELQRKLEGQESNARESYSVRGMQEKMDNNKNNKKFISNQELEIQQKKS